MERLGLRYTKIEVILNWNDIDAIQQIGNLVIQLWQENRVVHSSTQDLTENIYQSIRRRRDTERFCELCHQRVVATAWNNYVTGKSSDDPDMRLLLQLREDLWRSFSQEARNTENLRVIYCPACDRITLRFDYFP